MTYEEKLIKLLEQSIVKLKQHTKSMESYSNINNLGKFSILERFNRTAEEWKQSYKKYEELSKYVAKHKINPKSEYVPEKP